MRVWWKDLWGQRSAKTEDDDEIAENERRLCEDEQMLAEGWKDVARVTYKAELAGDRVHRAVRDNGFSKMLWNAFVKESNPDG